jgi:hypothetical protein
MSVIVMLRVSGDPAAFEQHAAANAAAIERIMASAKSNGVIAHRWLGREGEFLAVDEWPDAESFHAFFGQAQADIAPVMQAAGVSSPPEVTVWRTLDIDDVVGWGG